MGHPALGALMSLISHLVACGLCWDRVLLCRLPEVLHGEVSQCDPPS